MRESAKNRVTTATMRFIDFSSVIAMRWWFGYLIAWLALVQELLFFLLLMSLSGTLRIERFHLAFLGCRKLRQMPNKQNQLPAVLVFLVCAPSRHSREPDAVVNCVVKLSVAQVL